MKNKNYDFDNIRKNVLNIHAPKESLSFIENTFNCIKTSKLSNIAAIFTYGRETTIPDMFLKILNKLIYLDTFEPKLPFLYEWCLGYSH